MSADKQYDVAISFLAKHEETAAAFYKALAAIGLNVFFFPHSQETLAGTEGMESMREPFLRARVNLLLFADGWGSTPWTEVEERAIKDRCFEGDGWESLFVVTLDDAPIPKWMPRTLVRLDFSKYGFDQALGALKLKVQELGGAFTQIDAMKRAQLLKAERDDLAKRAQIFSSEQWITNVVIPSVESILDKVNQLLSDAMKELKASLSRNGQFGRPTIFVCDGVSLAVNWEQRFSNSLEEAGLVVAEYNGPLPLPTWMPRFEPKLLRKTTYKPDLTQGYELCWKKSNEKKALNVTTDELADSIAHTFLELWGKKQRGEIKQRIPAFEDEYEDDGF